MTQQDNTPWYRQFWPWFLISIPAGTIVAAIITINIAIDTHDGLVSADYYKEGLAIHKNANALSKARELGIQAELSFERGKSIVTLKLQSNSNQAHGKLQLALQHPTQAKQDILVDLQATAPNQYQANLPELGNNAIWNVQLNAPEAGWKLHGRLAGKQSQQLVLE